jgi:uncharacterized protein (TIGR03083 family)
VTDVDQALGVSALEEQFQSIDDLLVSLTPEQWKLPTALPMWDVQANVAHVIGTEAMLLGEPSPTVDVDPAGLPHIRNDIAAFNEVWVIALASASPSEMIDAYRERVVARLSELRGLPAEAWAADSFTPAGPDTYGRFMRIRVMDCWMHEQDIREAVGMAGHDDGGAAVDLAVDEMTSALGFVVGKRAGAPDGSSVTFDLTGASGRAIHVLVEGRATVVDSLPGGGPATVTLRMPVLRFSRLAGGRSHDVSGVEVEGDEALGRQVLSNLAFMI